MLIEALGLDSARVISLTGAGGKTSLMFALGREFADAGERVLLTTTTKISTREAECLGPPAVAPDLTALESGKMPGTFAAIVACSGWNERGDRALGFPADAVDRATKRSDFDRIILEADGSARRPLKAPAEHEPVVPSSTDVMISVAGLSGIGGMLDEAHLFRSRLWAEMTDAAMGAPVTSKDLALVVSHEYGLSKGLPEGATWTVFLNQADDHRRKSEARQVLSLVSAQGGKQPNLIVSGSLQPEPRIDFAEPIAEALMPISDTAYQSNR